MPKPAGPLKIVIRVNGQEAASGVVPVSAPLLFTANDCLDIGTDLGSPVSVDYYDQAPFKFNGEDYEHDGEVHEVARGNAWSSGQCSRPPCRRRPASLRFAGPRRLYSAFFT